MVFAKKNSSKDFEIISDYKSIYILLVNLFKNFKIWGEGELLVYEFSLRKKISREVISGELFRLLR